MTLLFCPYCLQRCRLLVRPSGISPLFFCLTHGWFWFEGDTFYEGFDASPITPTNSQYTRH